MASRSCFWREYCCDLLFALLKHSWSHQWLRRSRNKHYLRDSCICSKIAARRSGSSQSPAPASRGSGGGRRDEVRGGKRILVIGTAWSCFRAMNSCLAGAKMSVDHEAGEGGSETACGSERSYTAAMLLCWIKKQSQSNRTRMFLEVIGNVERNMRHLFQALMLSIDRLRIDR